jgi:hypothetical protein
MVPLFSSLSWVLLAYVLRILAYTKAKNIAGGMELWLKQLSTCLTGKKPWVQTLPLPKNVAQDESMEVPNSRVDSKNYTLQFSSTLFPLVKWTLYWMFYPLLPMDISPWTRSNFILIYISPILPLGLFLGESDATDCVVLRKVTEMKMFCFQPPWGMSESIQHN